MGRVDDFYEDLEDDDIVRQERKAVAKLKKNKARAQDKCLSCRGSGKHGNNPCSQCLGVGIIKVD